MADKARIARELKDLGKDWESSGVKAEPIDGDIMRYRAFIRGPPDSPYAGGLFEVSVELTKMYPFEPPKCKFVTKVWHPNVSSVTGAICLDILKSAWSPALTIKTALLSICALLTAPEPNDPQDAVVASQYKGDRKAFDAQARHWTEMYAIPRPEAGADAAAAVAAVGAPAGGAGASAVAKPAAAVVAKPASDPKVDTLVSMGFERSAAIAALAANDGNVEMAMNSLLSA